MAFIADLWLPLHTPWCGLQTAAGTWTCTCKPRPVEELLADALEEIRRLRGLLLEAQQRKEERSQEAEVWAGEPLQHLPAHALREASITLSVEQEAKPHADD